MTTPVAGYESIAALARALGMPTNRAWRRIAALKRIGAPVTRETVGSGYVRREARKTRKRVAVIGCKSIAEAAKRFRLNRATLWDRVNAARIEGRPLTREVLIDAYGPTGRRPGRPLSVERSLRMRDAARVLDAWASVYYAHRRAA